MQDGFLLLARRSPDRRCCPDTWDLPGGHIEQGETEIGAARRELIEEIGIVAGHGRLLATFDLPEVGGRPMLLSVVLFEDWAGAPTINDREHVALQWFSCGEAAKLPDLAVDAYRPLFASLPPN